MLNSPRMTLGRFVLLGPPRSCAILSHSIRMTSAGPPPSKPSKPGSISERYDKFIGRWPKVQAIHRMVVDGSRWCFQDIKTYWYVKRDLRAGKKLSELSLPELEVLVQSGGEIAKMIFLMSVLQIPGPGDVLILLLIFFPRVVLTRHFWSDQQRKEFFLDDINKAMNAASSSQLFGEPPSTAVSIGNAPYDNVVALSRLHGLMPFPGVQRRLDIRAQGLKNLDSILAAKLDSLTTQQLYFHMYIRRLTYSNLSDDAIRDKLRKWLSFSSRLTGFAYLMAPYYVNKD